MDQRSCCQPITEADRGRFPGFEADKANLGGSPGFRRPESRGNFTGYGCWCKDPKGLSAGRRKGRGAIGTLSCRKKQYDHPAAVDLLAGSPIRQGLVGRLGDLGGIPSPNTRDLGVPRLFSEWGERRVGECFDELDAAEEHEYSGSRGRKDRSPIRLANGGATWRWFCPLPPPG